MPKNIKESIYEKLTEKARKTAVVGEPLPKGMEEELKQAEKKGRS